MFLFCLVFAMSLCASVICALWSPAGIGLTTWHLFVVSNCECHFPIGILGEVWYLIVSIPDLCTLTYFNNAQNCVSVAYCFKLFGLGVQMSSEISYLVELSMKHLYNWVLTESGKPLKPVLGGTFC